MHETNGKISWGNTTLKELIFLNAFFQICHYWMITYQVQSTPSWLLGLIRGAKMWIILYNAPNYLLSWGWVIQKRIFRLYLRNMCHHEHANDDNHNSWNLCLVLSIRNGWSQINAGCDQNYDWYQNHHNQWSNQTVIFEI